jgi:hypothetical protein
MAEPVFAIAQTGIPSRNLWKIVHTPSNLHLCVVQGKRFANRAVAWLHQHQAIVDAVAKVAARKGEEEPDPHALHVAEWACDAILEAGAGRAGCDKWHAAASPLALMGIDADALLDTAGHKALENRRGAPAVPPPEEPDPTPILPFDPDPLAPWRKQLELAAKEAERHGPNTTDYEADGVKAEASVEGSDITVDVDIVAEDVQTEVSLSILLTQNPVDVAGEPPYWSGEMTINGDDCEIEVTPTESGGLQLKACGPVWVKYAEKHTLYFNDAVPPGDGIDAFALRRLTELACQVNPRLARELAEQISRSSPEGWANEPLLVCHQGGRA